ncbi:Z1 domain-containing protein [Ruegeria sp. HKCCD8929]|uniref:Z1 domain-containing protein n=1 Tax=Ruegeria sp. HKCCD8929 TaxID=2683006 RepID=UPI00148814DB|nr:Z1 domain-containing protein [Ruegeria sp. HKCCD8929]
MNATDWSTIVGKSGNNQYENRVAALKSKEIDTSSIEATVDQTIQNLQQQEARSFVIFGEPQSGKTEMMIALNAKLLDQGYPIIINLLTDSVDLLDQSLKRFRGSGLNPSPKQFSDLPSDPKRLRGQEWVVFCKKNARDLEKLIEFLRLESGLIVVDDEADYASPDGNVNKPEYDKTKINKLISDLIGKDGIYIGVTATPARLNLNNTFDNESERWVDFVPHPFYVGQDFFFPHSEECGYRLHTFAVDEGSERAEIQKAILHFLCGVAELHQLGKNQNFTMLVHTSGKKVEHAEDVELIQSTLATLSNASSPGFEGLRKKLWNIASQYGDADTIGIFVLRNIRKNTLVEINSRNPKPGKVAEIANPTSLFSFGVGGNIISRGVTFDNLLSMYFTRSVKGKFSQDTYIQRARMFGSREGYKEYFQLWIPETVMGNWSKCFAFHKLALEALRIGAGAPVWLSDHKTTPTSPASIDKSSVDFEGGEMSFALFDFDEEKICDLFKRRDRDDQEVLSDIYSSLNAEEFPHYVRSYLDQELRPGSRIISFHRPSGFGTNARKYTEEEKHNIRRTKGIFATNEYRRSENPTARHHLKVFHNGMGKARLFYKINGGAIKFIQNRR